jgi:hypothetical protein
VSEIAVTPLAPGRFGVEVSEGPVRTSHEVSVPDQLVRDLGLRAIDPPRIVYETFAFLLEREPVTSILTTFSLEEVASYFPDFYDELRVRCGA